MGLFYRTLLSIDDYLLYLKKNPEIMFEMNIIRNDLFNIQIINHNLTNEVQELESGKYSIIFLFHLDEKINGFQEIRNCLKEKFSDYDLKQINNENFESHLFLKIPKNYITLEKTLKTVVNDCYRFNEKDVCMVQLFKIVNTYNIKQVTKDSNFW